MAEDKVERPAEVALFHPKTGAWIGHIEAFKEAANDPIQFYRAFDEKGLQIGFGLTVEKCKREAAAFLGFTVKESA